jgi:FixJ family two-component response regulator
VALRLVCARAKNRVSPCGVWLLERVRAKWPQTKIIMASGVVEMDVVKKSQRLGAIDFVTKPFGREMLRQALDRAAATLSKAAD